MHADFKIQFADGSAVADTTDNLEDFSYMARVMSAFIAGDEAEIRVQGGGLRWASEIREFRIEAFR